MQPRAYLLIDVMIGGALAAVVIAGLLSVLVDARAKNVQATRDVVATQLVLESLERCRAAGFAGVSGATCPLAAPPGTAVPGQTGNYKRSIQSSVAGSPETINAIQLPFKDVTVTVTYVVGGPTAGTNATRTSQATTRIYQ